MRSDDERERITAEARSLLRDTASIGAGSNTAHAPLTPADPYALDRWRRQAEETEARIAAARAARRAAEQQPQSVPIDENVLDQRLAQEREFMMNVIGEAIGQLLAEERRSVMRDLQAEIRELKIEVAKLGSATAELRAQGSSSSTQLRELREIN